LPWGFTGTQAGTIVAGYTGELAFAINNMYDPYTGVGTHQPYQYDQIAPYYENVTVYRADWEVTFSSPSNNTLYAACVTTQDQNTTDDLNGKTVDVISERRMAAQLPLPTTGSQSVSFRGTVDMPKMAGMSRSEYLSAFTAFGHAVGANPTRLFYLKTALNDQAGNSGTAAISVKIVFHAVFRGYIAPGTS